MSKDLTSAETAANVEKKPPRWPDWPWALGVFMVSLTVLALFSWDRLKQPSPNFHFVDLAHSFLSGRLDTDTPRIRNLGQIEALKDNEDTPKGYYEALLRVPRHGHREQYLSWNDWSSYRILTLRGAAGEVRQGVFPWGNITSKADPNYKKRNDFHDLNGSVYHIICSRDVKSGCHGNKKEQVKYHVSFPPGPAILMMPLVAVQGYHVHDVWFTLFFAALCALLLFVLLQSLTRRGHCDRSRNDNLWLTALFIFGTVFFFSSIRGEVWFTALIVGVAFHIAALYCLIDMRRPLLAGVFVAFAMATRTPLAFLCVLPLLLVAVHQSKLRRKGWKKAIIRLAFFAAPVAAALAALMWYNYARFENVFEFGHTFLQDGQRNNVRLHGLMSGWFFSPNLNAAITNSPVLTLEGDSFLKITLHGLGLLWTTPVLFLLFVSPKRSWLFKALCITAVVVALPGLFYQNTGWKQFGYRFGLDWLPLLVVAFAVGGRQLTWRVKALIVFGIVVNAVGALTFDRFHQFYY
jgi:hypothetical protein